MPGGLPGGGGGGAGMIAFGIDPDVKTAHVDNLFAAYYLSRNKLRVV